MRIDKIAIVVDSGCDVPKDVIEKYEMKLLSFKIMYPEGDYTDGVDIDPATIYKRFPKEVPSTSTPTVSDVENLIREIKKEGYEKLIFFGISCHLSSTVNVVRMVLKEEKELEYFILDTKDISFGSGIIPYWAVKKLEGGMSYSELVNALPEKIKEATVYFYMDTLAYLKKGGRIGTVSSIVGNLLNVKPIIACNEEGIYFTVAMIRGNKHATQKLISQIKTYCGNDPVWIALLHGSALEEALRVKEILQKEIPHSEFLFEKQITASLAVHTGPGLIGISVIKRP